MLLPTFSCDCLERLRSAGVEDLSPRWVLANYRMIILQHDALVNIDGAAKSELDEVRERAGDIEGMCRFLDDLPIPCTLVHGDLDDSNVLEYMPKEWLEAWSLSTKSLDRMLFID